MYIDDLFLNFMNLIANSIGVVMTPIFRLISILGDNGFIFLFIGFILMLNKKSRWVGVSIWISILLGFIVNSLILKNIFMRLRPFMSSNPNYYKYWEQVGAVRQTGYSMPSGHTFAASAFMASLIFTCKQSDKKKFIILYFIVVIAMASSRMYLMHHYFTDCLVGAILGVIMAMAGKILTKKIYRFVNDNKNNKLFNFILNFDFMGNDE